ncbi:MAG: trigger factor [Patescibacteria group bacterium]|nr:trigger factor [Patescibacteria group bacterium]MCL5093786.1 trigger factor [Patescibacteria group bacterium]
MQVKKENLENSKVKLTIELEKKELEPIINSVYTEISKTVKAQGFRPGKAPRFIIEKEVGQENINAQILEKAISNTFFQAIIKENLVTVGAPEVKILKFVPTDGLTYEAVVSVMPELKLPDFSKIKVKKPKAGVEKREVDETLEQLRKQMAGRKEVERSAKEGDRTEIDFEGRIDNVPFEGGTSKSHPVIIGSKTLIPGFEEQLVGMKKGEEKEIEVTFPKDYRAENLAGKKAKFKVKMNLLEEIILPELTDEFATKVGPFKKIEDLKKDIEMRTLEAKKRETERNLENEILKKAQAEIKIETPKELIHEEVHRMMHEAEQNLAYSGLSLDSYLQSIKKTKEEFEKELEGEARERVKVGLILSEIVKKERISASEKELEEEIQKILAFVGPEQKEEAKKFYESEDGKRSIQNNILAKKAIEWLKKQVIIVRD